MSPRKSSTNIETKKTTTRTSPKTPKKVTKTTSASTTAAKKKTVASKVPPKVVKKEIPKENPKEIAIKPQNYLYSLLILVGAILITIYLFSWYNVKKEEELKTSYLITTNTIESDIKDLDSLSQILEEAPSSYFVYLSYTEDEDVYNLEKEIKRLIDTYKLNDIFYYVNLTELKKNNNHYLDVVEEKLDIKEINSIPAVIYVQNGEIIENNILDGVKDTKFKASDLEQLLDIYEFEKVK